MTLKQPPPLFYGERDGPDIARRIANAREYAKRENIMFRDAYTHRFNAERVSPSYTVGQKVLLHAPLLALRHRVKFNKKFVRPWVPDCTILRVHKNNTVLISVPLGQAKEQRVHVDRIKPQYDDKPTEVPRDSPNVVDAHGEDVVDDSQGDGPAQPDVKKTKSKITSKDKNYVRPPLFGRTQDTPSAPPEPQRLPPDQEDEDVNPLDVPIDDEMWWDPNDTLDNPSPPPSPQGAPSPPGMRTRTRGPVNPVMPPLTDPWSIDHTP